VSNPTLSWNLVSDVRELLAFPFMVQALAAGTIAAILSGVLGWYMVLRRQTFAGHTLSAMSFPGAAGGALFGLPGALGYYIACILAALAMSPRGTSRRGAAGLQSARIGVVQAVGLAAGFLFLSLSSEILGGLDDLLFGSFLGITPSQVVVLAIVAILVLAALAVIGRPLLFASLDPELAQSLGVPVRTLEIGFMLLLGLAVAATTQVTGALLVFALLVTPPATAQRLTARPGWSLVLSVGCALLVIWSSLGAAYFSVYPLGFFTTSIGFAIYLLALGGTALTRRHAQAQPV
jgi:zinc/manganese transport system permease protein